MAFYDAIGHGLSDQRERTVKKPVIRSRGIEEPAGDEKFMPGAL
jgi:hypothetical protein